MSDRVIVRNDGSRVVVRNDGSRIVARTQGTSGTVTTNLVDRGAWASNTAYSVGDIVHNEGASWFVKTAYTSSSFFNVTNLIALGAPKLFVNAYDFGVRGDGSPSSASANTSGILNAVDYLYARGGGIVYLPFGYIFVNQVIELDQCVAMWGGGLGATTIALADNSNCHVVQNFVSTGTGVANANRTSLMHLTIDGRKASQNGSGPYYGIKFETNPTTTAQTGTGLETFDMQHFVDHVRVRMTKGDGIHMIGRSAIKVSNTYVENAGGYGLYSTFDINLMNVECLSGDLSGYYLNNGSIRGVNLKSYLNGQSHTDDGDGFRIGSNANGVALSSVEAQNNWARGYYLNGANRCHVSGIADSNNMANGGYVAVELANASYNLVDVVCWQGMQGGSPVGNQDTGLKIAGGSNYNRVTMSHSGGLGDSVTGPAVSADSVMLQNWIVANGVQVAG